MIGHLPDHLLPVYGGILSKYFKDPETLFVVSTDFCHWGSRFDFTHRFKEEATVGDSIERLDRLGMELIEKHDLRGFTKYLEDYKNTICGRLPLKVYLATIQAAYPEYHKGTWVETQFVKYAQSERIVDNKDGEASSVSYASACTWLKQI